jgi:hypothetical protein
MAEWNINKQYHIPCQAMTRKIVAALVVLVALVLVAKITGTGPRHPTVETVYTAAQVRAGLGHNPRAWVGHAVLIRGLLATASGASTTPSVPPIAVLIDVPRLPRASPPCNCAS